MAQDRHGRRIDLILPGLGIGTGRSKDRFRASAETDNSTVFALRTAMVRDLASRVGGFELLRARMANRFTTTELHRAYIEGTDALAALLRRHEHPPLTELLTDYIAASPARGRDKLKVQIMRFIESLGAACEVTAFTSAAVERFIAGLTTQSRKVGRPASAATKNRYRAALSGFASWLVRRGYLEKHPIAFRQIRRRDEGPSRLPDMTADEYRAYFEALERRDPTLVPVFKVLIHTGADVSECIRRPLADGATSAPFTVRDCHFERALPRIHFRRTKVTGSLDRMVPIPKDVAALVQAHIERHHLKAGDAVFGMFREQYVRRAHERARKAIGRPELTRKDLRHIAAISWRRAGADLQTVKERLGHSTITQTVKYAAFGADDAFDAPNTERAYAALAAPKPTVLTLQRSA